MFLHSQGAAAYPENEDQQQRLREAAEGLRVATNAAAQNAIKKKLINRLEVSDATFCPKRKNYSRKRLFPPESENIYYKYMTFTPRPVLNVIISKVPNVRIL